MNQSKARQVNEAIERGEMENGHWFCAEHQRATLVDVEGPALTCIVCGSALVKWHPKLRVSERNQRHTHPAISEERSKALFSQMREAVKAMLTPK